MSKNTVEVVVTADIEQAEKETRLQQKMRESGLAIAKPIAQELSLTEIRKADRKALENATMSASKAFKTMRTLFADKETRQYAINFINSKVNKGDCVRLVKGIVEVDFTIKGYKTLFGEVIGLGNHFQAIVDSVTLDKDGNRKPERKFTPTQMLDYAYRWAKKRETPKKK